MFYVFIKKMPIKAWFFPWMNSHVHFLFGPSENMQRKGQQKHEVTWGVFELRISESTADAISHLTVCGATLSLLSLVLDQEIV